MRCPDCNRFVSMDNGDPEFNSLDAVLSGSDVHVDASVRSVRNCADCGTELKSLDLDLEADIPLSGFEGFKELSAEDAQCLLDSADASMDDFNVESEEGSTSLDEGGGGRFKKNMITTRAEVNLTVEWERGPDDIVKLTKNHEMTSENAASEFDECC